MTSEKQLVRHVFARAADLYDSVADYQREVGARLLAQCQFGAAPRRVLDAGCGTGHGLGLLAQRWPQADVIALDFAAPMLRQLDGASPLAVCGDMELLPLAADSVDLVWSSLAMQWCDAHRVAHEARRVLRRDGYFAATTLGPGTFAELRQAFAGVDEFRHTNDFVETDVLRHALSAADLEIVTLERHDMVRHYADLRNLLSSVRDLGASHVTSGKRRPGLMGKSAWRRFAENYERLRTARGLPLTYDTFFFLARVRNS